MHHLIDLIFILELRISFFTFLKMLSLKLPVSYIQLLQIYHRLILNRAEPVKIDIIKALHSHKTISNKERRRFKGQFKTLIQDSNARFLKGADLA